MSGISDKISELFSKKGNKKNVLKKISLEELRKEITYLEMQQKKLESEREQLEKEAQKLFEDSIGKPESTKRLNATKIKNIKDRIADIDRDLREINLRLGVLYKIQRLKEKAERTYNSKVWEKLIDNMDEQTLERWLADEKASEDEILDKLRRLYNAQTPEEKEEELSPDEKEILEAMYAVEKREKTSETATKELLEKKEEEKESS